MVKYAFEIFAIIIGLAFSAATYSLLTLLNAPIENKPMVIAFYGVIFFLTAPRFFFGNLIFYKRTHKHIATETSVRSKLVANLIDFYWCLFEFLLFFFVGTSMTTENPNKFIWGLLIISVGDVAWHGPKIGYLTAPENHRASLSWAIINTTTAISCLLFLYLSKWNPSTDNLWVLALVYTVAFFADFILNPAFYLQLEES